MGSHRLKIAHFPSVTMLDDFDFKFQPSVDQRLVQKLATGRFLAERLLFYSKAKLLLIDELGYLPFERRSAHLFFQLVARRYERASMLITTNQVVTQWGTVFGAVANLTKLALLHPRNRSVAFGRGGHVRLLLKSDAGCLPDERPRGQRSRTGGVV